MGAKALGGVSKIDMENELEIGASEEMQKGLFGLKSFQIVV